MIENPFIVKGYCSEEYFCDRKAETARLIENILGGSDTVLVSPRRYGKSGLILHTMQQLKKKQPEYYTLYTDISTTTSLGKLIDHLASAILTSFPEKTSLGKQFLAFFKRFMPYFTFNDSTGKAEIHLELVTPQEKNYTLQQLLFILEQAPQPVVLAIDEFQQITEYPEENVEALLRAHIQHLHNVRFIFSGSKRRMMSSIFNDAARPFYASCETLYLDKLDREVYARFIKEQFEENGRNLEDLALEHILEWTRCYTYYTQRVCHKLYDKGYRNISLDNVKDVCQDILDGESYNFLLLKEILPTQQWRFLTGVAKEGSVSQISSTAFISHYKIGSAATALRCAKALEDKELILKHIGPDNVCYEVYDVFFSRWLEREF